MAAIAMPPSYQMPGGGPKPIENMLLRSGLLDQSSLEVNDDDSNLLDGLDNFKDECLMMDDNLLLSSVRDVSKQQQVLSR